MNKNQKLIFISIYVAIAIVLDYIKAFIPFLNMPAGGSINIALIPIVVSSFHMGPVYGMLTGLIWWLISSILGLNPYFINIYQYIIDYIIPSVIIGLSSLFYKKKTIFEIEIGIVFAMAIRTLSLLVSGAVFWQGEYASNSWPAWIFTLSYNLPYSIATLIMLMIVIPLVLKSLKKYIM